MKDLELWRQTDVSSNPSYASHQCVTLGLLYKRSELWLSHWEKEQPQCWLPEWMISTAGKLSHHLSKALLALCHVLGSAGPCSGHNVISTVIIAVPQGQGLHGWLGLLVFGDSITFRRHHLWRSGRQKTFPSAWSVTTLWPALLASRLSVSELSCPQQPEWVS